MTRDEMLIVELISWIDVNLENSIKIDDIAVRAGYSKWHLQRIFFSVTGKRLGSYVRERKLELATRDLLEGLDSIMHISLKYGYGSQQAFTRVFSRKNNIPPGQCRQLYGRYSGGSGINRRDYYFHDPDQMMSKDPLQPVRHPIF